MNTFSKEALKKARKRFVHIRRTAERAILKAKKQRGKECLKAALATTSIEELVAIYELTTDGMPARQAILNRLAGLCATPGELRAALESLPRNMVAPMNPIRNKWERLSLKELAKADTSDKVMGFLQTCPPDSVSLRESIAAWRKMSLYLALAKLLGFAEDRDAIHGIHKSLVVSGIASRICYDVDRYATLYHERSDAIRGATAEPSPVPTP